jgi:alpha-tubulin suppressor-like RCC1 family protein
LGYRQWRWVSVVALVANIVQLGAPVLASNYIPQVPIPQEPIPQEPILQEPIPQAPIAKSSIPTISSYPTVSGTSRVQQTLKVTNGKWARTPTSYQYAWYRCDSKISQTKTLPANCEQIPNASSNALALSATEVGKYVSASVTAQNSSGSFSVWSASTPIVIAQFLKPVNTVSPTVSGNKFVSQRLTASNGSWAESPTEFAYSWYRCSASKPAANSVAPGCIQIEDAISATYNLTQLDVGKYLMAGVSAINSAGSSTKWSSTTTKVAALPKPLNTSAPEVSGTATFTRQLSVGLGKWSNYPESYTYQWFKCTKQVKSSSIAVPAGCTSIPGATGSTYTVEQGDIRSFIAASISASNVTGTSTTWSKSTSAVAAMPAPVINNSPRLVGEPQTTRVMSVDVGAWHYLPTSYTIQWFACKKQAKSPSASLASGCTLIPGAAAETYQVATAYRSMYVLAKVTAVNAVGSKSHYTATTSAIASPIPYAPMSLASPELSIAGNSGDAISGQAMVGSVLVAGQGTWLGFPVPTKNYSFWYRCFEKVEFPSETQPVGCYVIEGSQGRNTHVVTLADLGYYLLHEVIASNTEGVSRKYTSSTDAVTATPIAYIQPSLTGLKAFGDELRLQQGSWASPPNVTLAFNYSWYRCDSDSPLLLGEVLIGCVLIEGSEGVVHEVASQDVGNYIFAVVTASNEYGESTSAQANSLGLSESAPQITSALAVSGARVLGETLLLSQWESVSYPEATQSIQWLRCTIAIPGVTSTIPSTCSAIEGATSQTYSIAEGDLGKFVSVSVTLTNSLGSTTRLSSAAQAVGSLPVFAVAPSVSGDNFLGVSLSASPGVVTGTPTPVVSYQWLRCVDAVFEVSVAIPSSCSLISGATSSSYVTLAADLGKFVSVRVTATNNVSFVTSTSISTDAIEAAPGLAVAPAVSGARILGEELVVSSGTWSGFPTPNVAYQWVRCTSAINPGTYALPSSCSEIQGATASTYVSIELDLGTHISVAIIATNSRGSMSSIASVSEVIGVEPSTSQIPTVEGTPITGNLIRTSQIVWAATPSPVLGLQWYRCSTLILAATPTIPEECSPIENATSSTYVLSGLDAGQFISVASSASNAAGAVTKLSQSTTAVGSIPILATNPTISGDRWIGSNLVAVDGQWLEFPTATKTYQWYRCSSPVSPGSAVPSHCSEAIAGATTFEYTLDGIDAGKYIAVVIEHSNSFGTARVIASQNTATYLPPSVDSEPTLSGDSALGSTLTHFEGLWTGYPAPSLRSEWFTCEDSSGMSTSALDHSCGKIQPPALKAMAVSAGSEHSCAVSIQGEVKCWGKNSNGQLGDGSTANRLAPVAVAWNTQFNSIGAGDIHTCGVTVTGYIACWGSNSYGQLGDGTTTQRLVPVLVSGISNAVSVSAGASHSCAVLSTGGVRCWGNNVGGKLGDGTTTQRLVPVVVSGISNAVSVSAGASHSCAVLSTGGVRCWGNNASGKLGDGTTTQRLVPVVVSGISNAVSVSAGYLHSCAVLSTGEIRCWGSNTYGQLGDGTSNQRLTPVGVLDISSANTAVTGNTHTCALLHSGLVKCWGFNTNGQLGDGTQVNQARPVNVSNLTGVASISEGNSHLCVTLLTEEVRCWGYNGSGQLGDKTTAARLEPPTPVTGDAIGNSLRLEPAHVGKFIAVRVTAENTGSVSTYVAATISRVTAIPTPTKAPSRSGNTLVGQDLTLEPGQFVEFPISTFQVYKWYRCSTPVLTSTSVPVSCALISGQTGLTYRQTAEDAGFYVTGAVGRGNDIGSIVSIAAVATQTSQPPINTFEGYVDGEPLSGESLNASEGIWQGFPIPTLQIQWYRCATKILQTESTAPAGCATIAAATSAQYLIAPADMGYFITFAVTRENYLGSVTKVAPSTQIVTGSPVVVSAPILSGTRISGSLLTATAGSWLAYPEASITRQWYRCDSSVSVMDVAPINCVAIEGETGLTFMQTIADAGKFITVVTSHMNSSGSKSVWSSSSLATAYPPTLLEEPTVTGTPNLNATLSVVDGSWFGYPSPNIAYQWYRCSAMVENPGSVQPTACTQIATGANSQTYSLIGPDMGSHILARVSATNLAGSVVRFTASTPVATGVASVQVVPEIAGIRSYGQTLTVLDGSWWSYPATTETRYQWYRCAESVSSTTIELPGTCIQIPDATNNHYTLIAADSGQYVTASVSLTNAKGTSRSLASQSTATTQVPFNVTEPSLNGVLRHGELLSISDGVWQGFPKPEFKYQWFECTNSIDFASNTRPLGCKELRSDAKISVSSTATCVAQTDGAAYCWGALPTTGSSNVPILQSGDEQIVQVEIGGGFACYLLIDSSVKCQGVNSSGQLGDGSFDTRNSPVRVSGLNGVRSISSGDAFSCALLIDRTVKCWGNNGSGQLGLGNTLNQSTPQSITGLGNVISLDAGQNHACAVIEGGTIKCWGLGTSGQIGNGLTGTRQSPTPVSNITNSTSVSAGGNHTCAVLSTGGVRCWGLNSSGQLGNASNASTSIPVGPLNLASGAVSVSSGDNHTCVIMSDGTGKCWGSNSFGQLGNGTTTTSLLPSTISSVSDISQIAAGQTHTCVVHGSGNVSCWGANTSGQVGDGSQASPHLTARSISFNLSKLLINEPDFGKNLLISVSASNNSGTKTVFSSSRGPVFSSPVLLVSPSFEQSFTEGERLSVGNGSWISSSPISGYGFTWYRCPSPVGEGVTQLPTDCEIIDHATDSSYVLTKNDAGKWVGPLVSATSSAGSGSYFAGSVGPIMVAPYAVENPSIVGEPLFGNSINASLGSWDGYPDPTLSYDWFVCDEMPNLGLPENQQSSCSLDENSVITNGLTYKAFLVPQAGLPTRDEGAYQQCSSGTILTLSQNWTNSVVAGCRNDYVMVHYSGFIRTSTTQTWTIKADIDDGFHLAIGGNVLLNSWQPNDGFVQGSSISLAAGIAYPIDVWYVELSAYADFNVQWASQSTYEPIQESFLVSNVSQKSLNLPLVERHAGKYIVLRATAKSQSSNQATASSQSAWSNVLGPIGKPPTLGSPPTVVGSRVSGASISHNGGDWVGFPTPSTSYQWYGCGEPVGSAVSAKPSSCEPIVGETDSVYEQRDSDAGRYISLAVTKSNQHGNLTAWTSSTTPTQVSPSMVSAPVLTGTASLGSRLSLNVGTWMGFEEPQVMTEWFSCGNEPQLETAPIDSDCRRINSAANSLGLGGTTSCQIVASTKVYCWGSNADGRLGDGTTTNRLQAAQVLTIDGASKVVTGGGHSCALTQKEKIYCWGLNVSGQLGSGTITSSATPLLIQGLAAPTDVFLGGSHSCAVESIDKSVKCWGLNSAGQLGDGTTTNRLTPTIISGISDAMSVSAGGEHSCYLSTSGTVRCWGANTSGQLGDGSTTRRLTPVLVQALDNVKEISAAGVSHTCALKNDGTVWCWGSNSSGELGDGTFTNRLAPVRVVGIESATHLSVDASHACVILQNGNIRCWGNNSSGKLGDGTQTNRNIPVLVTSPNRAVVIEAGGTHTCAVYENGNTSCWGLNSSGQLGLGTSTSSSIPVQTSQSADLGALQGNTYVIQSDDIGRYILVKVTAKNLLGLASATTHLLAAGTNP